jgi:hypothetical protein
MHASVIEATPKRVGAGQPSALEGGYPAHASKKAKTVRLPARSSKGSQVDHFSTPATHIQPSRY